MMMAYQSKKDFKTLATYTWRTVIYFEDSRGKSRFNHPWQCFRESLDHYMLQ